MRPACSPARRWYQRLIPALGPSFGAGARPHEPDRAYPRHSTLQLAPVLAAHGLPRSASGGGGPGDAETGELFLGRPQRQAGRRVEAGRDAHMGPRQGPFGPGGTPAGEWGRPFGSPPSISCVRVATERSGQCLRLRSRGHASAPGSGAAQPGEPASFLCRKERPLLSLNLGPAVPSGTAGMNGRAVRTSLLRSIGPITGCCSPCMPLIGPSRAAVC